MGYRSEDASIDAIAELRRFVRFLESIYGVLAGISTLFPLGNHFLKAIPLPTGAEGLYTTIAWIMSVFSIFIVFVARDYLLDYDFVKLSVLCLLAWVALLYNHLYLFQRNALELSNSINYGFSVMLLSLAFTILAAAEYTRRVRLEPLQSKVAHPRNRSLLEFIETTPDGKPHLVIASGLIDTKDAILLMLFSVHPEPLSLSEIHYLIATSWKSVSRITTSRSITNLRRQALLYVTSGNLHGLTRPGIIFVENDLLPKVTGR